MLQGGRLYVEYHLVALRTSATEGDRVTPEPHCQCPLGQEPHRIRPPLFWLYLLRGAGSEQGVARRVERSHEHRPHLRVQPATHHVHALLVREDREAP